MTFKLWIPCRCCEKEEECYNTCIAQREMLNVYNPHYMMPIHEKQPAPGCYVKRDKSYEEDFKQEYTKCRHCSLVHRTSSRFYVVIEEHGDIFIICPFCKSKQTIYAR